MNDDEYEAISEAEWKTLATTEITHLTDEEKDYLPRAWDEWIARVRRDAYDWGRYDERMSLAYAPPESDGGPTDYPETKD